MKFNIKNKAKLVKINENEVEYLNALSAAKNSIEYFKNVYRKIGKSNAKYFAKVIIFENSSEALVLTDSTNKIKQNNFAHLWLKVNDIFNDLYFSSTIEIPESFKILKLNDAYVIEESNIEDWMIIIKNDLYGGYTIRYYRNKLRNQELIDFDNYFGEYDYKMNDELQCDI